MLHSKEWWFAITLLDLKVEASRTAGLSGTGRAETMQAVSSNGPAVTWPVGEAAERALLDHQ